MMDWSINDVLQIQGGEEFLYAFYEFIKNPIKPVNVFVSTEDIKNRPVQVIEFDGLKIIECGKTTGRIDCFHLKEITELKVIKLELV